MNATEHETEEAMDLYVNGYGAAGPDDKNYAKYLGALRLFVAANVGPVTIWLAGGRTNDPDTAEAAAMFHWFFAHGIPVNATFRLLDKTTTARDNLIAFRKAVGDVPVHIACERTRQHYMRFFATRLFSRVTMVPVAFDDRSLEWKNRLKTYCWKTPLEIAAYYSTPTDRLRLYLRGREVARARAAE